MKRFELKDLKSTNFNQAAAKRLLFFHGLDGTKGSRTGREKIKKVRSTGLSKV
jgi:hypothetical protein